VTFGPLQDFPMLHVLFAIGSWRSWCYINDTQYNRRSTGNIGSTWSVGDSFL